jgi:hypothetical protein
LSALEAGFHFSYLKKPRSSNYLKVETRRATRN